MKHKALRFVLCVMLFCMSFPGVVQAHELSGDPLGWHAVWSIAPGAEIDKNICGYEVNNETAYDGQRSFQVTFPQEEQANTMLQLLVDLPDDLEPGEYCVSFAAKGTYRTDKIMAGLNGAWGESYCHMNFAWTTMQDGDWTIYSRNINVTQDSTHYFYMQFLGLTNYMLIDSIRVEKDGVNYIENGSCESILVDSSIFSPKNVLVNPMEEFIAVSWINPESKLLTGVELYDVTEGEKKLESELTSLCGAVNNIDIYNDDEEIHTYKILFSFDDGEFFEYIFSAGQQVVGRELGEWVNSGQKWCSVQCDTEVKCSGQASAKMISNIDGIQDNTYNQLIANIKVEPGEYEIEYYAKAENASDVKAMIGWNFNEQVILADKNATYDWKKYSYTRNIEGDIIDFQFLVENLTEGFWIDDFAVYKIEDGQRVTENLFLDGSFEVERMLSLPGSIDEVESEAGNRYISMNWQKTKKADRIYIYTKVFDSWEKCADLSAENTDAVFNRLLNDMQYEFAIVPVNAYGVEGERVYITNTTIAPDYEIGDFVLEVNGKTTQTLQSGTANISVSIKNTHLEESINAELIVALYKDNVLVTAPRTAKAVVTPSEANELPETITVEDLSIPEEGCRAEVFLWSSLKDMWILRPCTIYQ